MPISKKRVLFISKELIAADLAYQMRKEGCDVKLYIENETDLNCFDGFVRKTRNWRKELTWVGKDGLIVFDDVGYGDVQDRLRRDGFLVVGGSGDGDKLEIDREYGQQVLKNSGLDFEQEFETRSFSINNAIGFLRKRKGSWVLKQTNHNSALTYAGKLEDGSDTLSLLEKYRESFGSKHEFTLQKKVQGVEIAVGRFFNGNDWVGPIIINQEHKHFCNDDIGPLGGETGTLMWYEKNEKNRIFSSTLAKLKPHLQKSHYKGYVDINNIITGKGKIYPLEITSRFGSSTNQLQSELQISPWGQFLDSLARGKDYKLKFKPGFGVSVTLTVQPFPYKLRSKELSQEGVNIFFSDKLTSEEFSSIHFEDVSKKTSFDKDFYSIAGNSGYILYITGNGRTIEAARSKVYRIIDKIVIPKMFYRTDIALRFANKERDLLKKWGWI
jgi:phosphoribosylamine--glycine ligase